MKENNLQAKISKCSFAQKETKYLGYIISKKCKKAGPSKSQGNQTDEKCAEPGKIFIAALSRTSVVW